MSRGLYKLYQRAGPSLLAYRMEKLFVRIVTPEDIALHNDVLKVVLQIIEGEERDFFKGMVEMILYPKINRRKRLLFRLAEYIMHIGQKKG